MRCKLTAIIFSFLGLIVIHEAGASTLLTHVAALSNLNGASSFEEPVRDYVLAHLQVKPNQISVDHLGNVIAYISDYDPKLKTALVLAHMDEVGFIITHIDDHGYIEVAPLGGISQRPVEESPKVLVLS